MLLGLYIFVDDDFKDPIYGEPASEDLDEDSWEAACEAVNDALDGEGPVSGLQHHGEHHVAWLTRKGEGVSFVAVVTDDVAARSVRAYLKSVAGNYFDEVDDPRNPERDGVEDLVGEVLPPWEDDEED